MAAAAGRSTRSLVGMRISTVRAIKRGALVVGALYGVGAILVALALGWSWLTKGTVPPQPWWQYLLAPVAVVGIWLSIELMGTFITNGFSFQEPQTPRRRALGTVGVVVLLVTLLLVLPLVSVWLDWHAD